MQNVADQNYHCAKVAEAQLADAEQAAKAEASARRDFMQRLESVECAFVDKLEALEGIQDALGQIASMERKHLTRLEWKPKRVDIERLVVLMEGIREIARSAIRRS